jgi:hypothetical protein
MSDVPSWPCLVRDPVLWPHLRKQGPRGNRTPHAWVPAFALGRAHICSAMSGKRLGAAIPRLLTMRGRITPVQGLQDVHALSAFAGTTEMEILPEQRVPSAERASMPYRAR